MDERISKIKDALYELGKAVEDLGAPHGKSTLRELWGWNCPALNAQQLGSMAKILADKIAGVSKEKLNSKFDPQTVIVRIDDFRTNTLQYIWNGNAAGAAPQYFALLHWISLVFEPVYEFTSDWEKYASEGMLPRKLSSKLRSYKAQIANYDEYFEGLDEKIKFINQAHDAANELPTDLEMLRGATEEVAEAKANAERNKILSEAAYEEITKLLQSVRDGEAEARQLVRNTEDAYSAATTRGLGESFQRRANRLAWSMWTWVAGLITALVVGAIIGHYRVSALQDLLKNSASNGPIVLSAFLAIVSVAAPVWFAWIATKQIGHRFRLSEDYAFKASIAQAYEGYRREAARVDANFAKRLFASALDRLEEAPIRFVEHETFGSPWHELVKMRSNVRPNTGNSVSEVSPSQSDGIVAAAENKT